ncbi:hypothetical protein CVT24_005846 [Panaeolus cyanescens]|uniref:Uncharacterized protein n=1 Tax=Panaeolus cyanescens TaxID=181874 RepID=A0A409YF17_9AGAR|nr:hypothetical protein CVT24_005846 [Panaeolus cyanescens]
MHRRPVNYERDGTYEPVDPFRSSLAFSVRMLFGRRMSGQRIGFRGVMDDGVGVDGEDEGVDLATFPALESEVQEVEEAVKEKEKRKSATPDSGKNSTHDQGHEASPKPSIINTPPPSLPEEIEREPVPLIPPSFVDRTTSLKSVSNPSTASSPSGVASRSHSPVHTRLSRPNIPPFPFVGPPTVLPTPVIPTQTPWAYEDDVPQLDPEMSPESEPKSRPGEPSSPVESLTQIYLSRRRSHPPSPSRPSGSGTAPLEMPEPISFPEPHTLRPQGVETVPGPSTSLPDIAPVTMPEKPPSVQSLPRVTTTGPGLEPIKLPHAHTLSPNHSSSNADDKDTGIPPQPNPTKLEPLIEPKKPNIPTTWQYVLAFFLDTVPRQVYLHLLLRLPYLYYSRVTHVFEDADMDVHDLKRGIFESARKEREWASVMKPVGGGGYELSPAGRAYQDVSDVWMKLVDSLIKEWETLNIISALLLTAILTVLQLDGAATDPIIRFSALVSMTCALVSLLFGCIYIIRFGTMRKVYKAAELAAEAQKVRIGIWWNVWVMLGMPAIWLGWSILSYLVCIMTFVWRTGAATDSDHQPSSDHRILAPRIVVSVILALGIIYLALILKTLRRYGSQMDKVWQIRIRDWVTHNGFSGITLNAQRDDDSERERRYYRSNPDLRRGVVAPPPIPRMPTFDIPRPEPMVIIQHDGPGYSGWSRGYGRPPSLRSFDLGPRPPTVVQMSTPPSLRPVATGTDESVGDNGGDEHSFSGPPDLHLAPEMESLDRLGGSLKQQDMEQSRGPTIYVTRLVDLSDDLARAVPPLDGDLQAMGLDYEQWKELYDSARSVFRTTSEVLVTNPDHAIHPFIKHLNDTLFNAKDGQVQLCEERGTELGGVEDVDLDVDDKSHSRSGAKRRFVLYYFSTAEGLPFDAARYEVRDVKDREQMALDRRRVDVVAAFEKTVTLGSRGGAENQMLGHDGGDDQGEDALDDGSLRRLFLFVWGSQEPGETAATDEHVEA